jgi:hypothetical protein
MKYQIDNKRLMGVMEKFMRENIGDLNPDLERRLIHGYNREYTNVLYIEEVTDSALFRRFDDKYIYENVKWEVNEILQPLFDFFGDVNFEDFVMWYFEVDLTNKGNKKYNWVIR